MSRCLRLTIVILALTSVLIGCTAEKDLSRVIWTHALDGECEEIKNIYTDLRKQSTPDGPGPFEMMMCVEALTAMGSEESIMAIIDLTELGGIPHSEPGALACSGYESVVERLYGFVRSENRVTRSALASNLGNAPCIRGDRRAAQMLCSLAGDKDVWVRYSAVQSLGNLATGAAIDIARNCLSDMSDDPHEMVRIEVLRQLAQFGGPRAQEIVRAGLERRLPNIKSIAIRNLHVLPEEEAMRQLRAFAAGESEHDRGAAAVCAARMKNDAAIEILTNLANDPSQQVRYELATSLRYRFTGVEKLLEKLLNDPSYHVAWAAAESLCTGHG